jgi:type VI secretion system Hcp family effector
MAFHSYASFKGKKQGQLKAESLKAKRNDKWSELHCIEMGSEVPVDPKSGRPKAARTQGPLTITKSIGGASPQLLDAHWKAELFDEVVIEIVGRPDTGAGEVVVERITLTNALISKVHRYAPRLSVEQAEHDTDLLEEYSFTFGKILVENLAASTSTTDDVLANNQ